MIHVSMRSCLAEHSCLIESVMLNGLFYSNKEELERGHILTNNTLDLPSTQAY
jgi:hypothetical protein